MAYTIPLTPAGEAMYDKRDRDLERAVIFLVERIGPERWAARKKAAHNRFDAKLRATQTPREGISVRDREDEIGWYLFLAETTITDPPAVDSDQANRVGPYLTALGRKLESILKIQGVDRLIDGLVRELKDQDPDQALFELFVGAAYVEEGWTVEAVAPRGGAKSPDFRVHRGTQQLEVECKRLTRRAEYSEKERDQWLRLWSPVGNWLIANQLSYIFTVQFHVELNSLPPNFLISAVTRNMRSLQDGAPWVQKGVVSIRAERVNFPAIRAALKESWIKCNSARERLLIAGRYERDGGLTCAIYGNRVPMGPETVAGNLYWNSIEAACGAFWDCDAAESIDAKSRDIMTRLSGATSQLSGEVGGVVHVGIEADSNAVERLRAQKIRETLGRFDPGGKPLEWVYVHYFRTESMPEGNWTIDETVDWNGIAPESFRPLQSGFLVLPPGAPSWKGHLFTPPST